MNGDKKTDKKPPHLWLLWSGLVLAGIFLLAEAFQIGQLTRWTARFGFGLVYTALALIVAAGRWTATIGIAVVWVSVILCYFL